jgi:hypothetical protein
MSKSMMYPVGWEDKVTSLIQVDMPNKVKKSMAREMRAWRKLREAERNESVKRYSAIYQDDDLADKAMQECMVDSEMAHWDYCNQKRKDSRMFVASRMSNARSTRGIMLYLMRTYRMVYSKASHRMWMTIQSKSKLLQDEITHLVEEKSRLFSQSDIKYLRMTINTMDKMIEIMKTYPMDLLLALRRVFIRDMAYYIMLFI